MHTSLSVFIVGLAAVVLFQPAFVPPSSRAGSKDELEKEIAREESDMAMTEEGKAAKKALAELLKELDKAEKVELYSLNHRKIPKDNKEVKKAFHGYGILAESSLKTEEDRKKAIAFLGKVVHWNSLRKADCFHPRHGIRVTIGKKTLDFVLCFECNRVNAYENDKPLGFGVTITIQTIHLRPMEVVLNKESRRWPPQ